MHLAGLFAAVCLAAPAASAQSAIAVAQIPFAFTVGGTQYPAGAWLIQDTQSNPLLQKLRSADGKHQLMVMTVRIDGGNAAGPAKLTFRRYGGEHFLSEIWRQGGDGAGIGPGRAERELIAAGSRPQTVVLVLAGAK